MYKAISTNIRPFQEVMKQSGGENDIGESIEIFPLDELPKKLIADLDWMIPVSLSTIQFPILIHQNELGIV